MTADQANVTGWEINEPNSNARCTLFGSPPTVAAQIGGADWEPTTWWTGYQLIVPGNGSQDLLKRTSENTLSPSMSGMTFPIVTKQNWMVRCGVLTDNETNGGEGFLAQHENRDFGKRIDRLQSADGTEPVFVWQHVVHQNQRRLSFSYQRHGLSYGAGAYRLEAFAFQQTTD